MRRGADAAATGRRFLGYPTAAPRPRPIQPRHGHAHGRELVRHQVGHMQRVEEGGVGGCLQVRVVCWYGAWPWHPYHLGELPDASMLTAESVFHSGSDGRTRSPCSTSCARGSRPCRSSSPSRTVGGAFSVPWNSPPPFYVLPRSGNLSQSCVFAENVYAEISLDDLPDVAGC